MEEEEARGIWERLQKIQDPNEYIEAFHAKVAREHGMAEPDLFPLSKDSAGDLIEGFIGVWLAMRAELPIKSREQVIEAIDDMIGMLKEMMEYIPAETAALERDVLRCLRKGVGRVLNG